MPRPTAASAAASVITKIAKTWPCRAVGSMNSLPVTREGDQIQIDGVQNQFDRHQDDDHVAAGEHADHAQQKQGCAQDQVVQRRDVE